MPSSLTPKPISEVWQPELTRLPLLTWNRRLFRCFIQFEVQDTGIAPADRPRLFEKFFHGSQREARAERGSKLGLAIVRSIAERHSGKA